MPFLHIARQLLVWSQLVKFTRISSFSSIWFTCPLLAGTHRGLFNMLSSNYLRKAFLTSLLATTLLEARMSLHMTPLTWPGSQKKRYVYRAMQYTTYYRVCTIHQIASVLSQNAGRSPAKQGYPKKAICMTSRVKFQVFFKNQVKSHTSDLN